MLSSHRISAVLVSTNLDQCREFYEKNLGFSLSPETIKNHLLFKGADGTTILIYGRGVGNKSDHTQVRFWTTDIEKDVKALAEKGVTFEEYDFPTLKTVNHIASTAGIGKSAWFKDPDGNILALFQAE